MNIESWVTKLPCDLSYPSELVVLFDLPSYKAGCTQQHSFIKWKSYTSWAKQALKTQVKLHEEVFLMPQSQFLLHNLLSPSLYTWSHMEFPMISRRGRKDLSLVYKCFCKHLYVGITCNWTAKVLQPPSGTSWEDNGEGKSSKWAEFQAVNMVGHFAQ